MSDYIRICEVEKYYGSASNVTRAVDRVSFQVDKGEFVGVMGPSGSGKTTLLNMLATIDRVTAGHIYYESTDITELSEDALSDFRRDNLGFVFQEYNLLDTLTIEENIVLELTLQEKPKQEIVAASGQILKLLQIEDIRDKFPYQVSGGQKQRCACARAMVNRPRLLLADEPTGALDSRSAQILLETFTDLNRRMEATILMVTHDAFSASYCSRILFLQDGKIFYELEQYFSMKLQGLMGVMIGLATFFIMLIVSWLINYMVKFMLERRSAEFGIYLLLGMKKRTIAGLYIRENFLLGGVSFLIGTAAGILLQQVLMAVMFSMVQMEYRLSIAPDGRTMLMAAVCFGGCYLLALFRCKRKFKKMNIQALMNAKRRNEEIREKHEHRKQLLFPLSVFFILLFWKMFGRLASTQQVMYFLIGLVVTIDLFYRAAGKAGSAAAGRSVGGSSVCGGACDG